MRNDGQPEPFGDYIVYEKLGVGGMAIVHRAKKQGIAGFSRVVALKRMLPHLSHDESFVRSFIREATLASMLQHANIVQIYDLGIEGDVYFMAMEYIRGRDLRKVLRWALHACGPPPIEVSIAILYQLLDALHYAHTMVDESGQALGLVHRDISPSNLLLAEDGNLKIIDFGIAKAQTKQLRTQSGAVKGKFAYMAPEVLKGSPADVRTDLFSVGIVAYELLTTRPLFGGRTELDTLRNVQTLEIVPPRKRNPRCPGDLNDIVMTALSRDPQFRWQSAAAMRFAIENVGRDAGRASSREVREWIEWAFNLPTPKSLRRSDGPPTPAVGSEAGYAPNLESVDDVSIQIVWGTNPSAAIPGLSRVDAAALAGPDERSTHAGFKASEAITAEVSVESLQENAPPAFSDAVPAPLPPPPPGPPPRSGPPDAKQPEAHPRTLLGVRGVSPDQDD